MVHFKLPLVVCLALLCVVFSAELSRITHLLNFLSTNVGSEPGSPLRLHASYYGAEVLDILSKHPGYIQKNILLASDYTYKLGTFVAQLQINSGANGNTGGFRAFGEKKEGESEQAVTVVNSYYAGRVLEISSDSTLGGGENHFKRINSTAALQFLANARNSDGVYRLSATDKHVSVASVYYGTMAWELFARHTPDNKLTATKPESIVAFLKKMFKDGGFKNSETASTADLQSTYLAITLLNKLGQWEAFAGKNRKDTEKQLITFLLAHKDTETSAFAERAGEQPDVVSTSQVVKIVKLLKLEIVESAQVTQFVASLQSITDGGFRLKQESTSSGHHVNTYFALQCLEDLGTSNILEEYLRQSDRVILPPQFMSSAAFVAVIVLILVLFAGILYLLPEDDDEDEEEDGEKGDEKDGEAVNKKKVNKRKTEPTITLLRNKITKECVDTDGVPYSINNLNKKEWEIVSSSETPTHTVYVIRKKEVSGSVQTKGGVRESPKVKLVRGK